MYGTQTRMEQNMRHNEFENDVKMYGTQTIKADGYATDSFENAVKMYGTQTGQGTAAVP